MHYRLNALYNYRLTICTQGCGSGQYMSYQTVRIVSFFALTFLSMINKKFKFEQAVIKKSEATNV